jgi:hypothetical protein
VVTRNPTLTEVLTRAAALDLPGWYLVAGALCQTVWNVTTGQPPGAGILDYDVVYFDASDLSWAAEDAVIKRGDEVFAGLPAPVQIRNQARVHLWYEPKFGIPCPPHTSSEAAISTYEATTACLGVRLLPATAGASTPPTACPTCSAWSCAQTRCSPRATSTRPKSPADPAVAGADRPALVKLNDVLTSWR